ncbi:MAG: paaG [Actinomycetia bacterium]|nr:paaG [Actinomycetes bacterium]
MSDTVVDVRVDGHVAVITLDRPEARNAVDGRVARQLEAALDAVESDDDVRVAVLAATGPVFCAGADLKAIAAGDAASLETERGGFAGICRRTRVKPLVAVVDGPALAGGCEIVAACDLVVASTAASFGIPEVTRGLVAAAGGLFRLPDRLPLNLAVEAALTGAPITAERAYVVGFVNALTEPGGALAAGLALAERVAANAPEAVRVSRRLALGAAGMSEDERWQASTDAFATAVTSAEAQEGTAAFIEKRPPAWPALTTP